MASSTRLPRALSARIHHLATTLPLSRHTPKSLQPARAFSSFQPLASAWSPGPAPPRLPKEEQELFERLQRQSAAGGAFSTPRQDPSSEDTAPLETFAAETPVMKINQSPHSQSEGADLNVNVDATGQGEELHPNVRRGAAPEFTGDVNPKTGEVGGPKNDPLRWGAEADWSYNGRVTDF